MQAVSVLWQDEPLAMDEERLAGLYLELGEARAQAVVMRAVEDISVQLEQITGFARAGRLDALRRVAEEVADTAIPFGLQSLARVAGDVATLAARGDDPVAQAACLARLERVANRSMRIVFHLSDHPE